MKLSEELRQRGSRLSKWHGWEKDAELMRRAADELDRREAAIRNRNKDWPSMKKRHLEERIALAKAALKVAGTKSAAARLLKVHENSFASFWRHYKLGEDK